jgi:hypothetical protein
MKNHQHYFILFFLGAIMTSFGQTKVVTKQEKREAAKVDTLYTIEERANIGQWLYSRVNDMQLTEDVREEYDAIFFSRIYDLRRLNDKDKDYNEEEIRNKFDEIVDKMNMEVKAILTTDQYINHLENFAEIERSVYRRLNWDKK